MRKKNRNMLREQHSLWKHNGNQVPKRNRAEYILSDSEFPFNWVEMILDMYSITRL